MQKERSFKRTVPLVFLTLVLLVSFVALPVSGAPVFAPDPSRLMGFTAEKTAWELEYEELFKAIPDPAIAEMHSIALTEHPTMAGTDWDWVNLEYTVEKLQEYGVDVEVTTYYPYWSEPKSISVEMIAPTQQTLPVKEMGYPWQEYWDEVTPGWNAYSVDGDVTADLVYLNYGRDEDYAKLAELGVDVRGKVGIARYGFTVRGAKTFFAEKYGLAGLILYSDPIEDGYIRGPVYPDGPWRPPDGIQRGSLVYIWYYPGDPLTPGWAATEKAYRLPFEEAYNIPHSVPTTPLGYGSAEPLLAALGGPEAPEDWQGGLPFTYHVGPGSTKVHLKVDLDNHIQPISNIIVKIPGSKYPDQYVILGTHRDGWVYGTRDSNSGTVAFMEMARAFGQLMQQGWQPERTIVLAMWDAEEYFELGSVEWAEDYQQELRKKAVLYINMDGAGGGQFFSASGVPALDDFIYEATEYVEEPRTPGQSIFDDWYARSGNQLPRIGRLGGGSDYSVFINFLGIPTGSMGFGTPGGSYHSAYDDLYHMTHWGDPGYLHHAAAARIGGIVALRMANADILPYKYSKYAGEVSMYMDNVNNLQVELYGEQVIDFSREMEQAIEWEQAAVDLEAKVDAILDANPSIPPELVGAATFINDKLICLERDLTQAKGVPDRPWFKHMIYASSSTGRIGYGAEYMPALEDMIRAGEWAKVRNYKALINNSLTTATNTTKTAYTAK